jgi:hypothetical protein
MASSWVSSCATAVVAGLSIVGVAGAQPVEGLGTRALGMAGAFVAVADDPAAVYWNPAGLAGGDLFGATIDVQWTQRPRADEASVNLQASEGRAAFVGLATPPLGLAYYRLREYGRDRLGSESASRAGEMAAARLDTHQAAVTVLQTLVEGVTVGATLKYVRGTVATGSVTAATRDEVRLRARRLEGRASSAFDVDFGAMVTVGRAALGLLARNLLEPTFTASSGRELALGRHLRAGVSFRPVEGWVIAADADLTATESVTGRWRRAAIGAERWSAGRGLGIRGGVRFSTRAAAVPVAAAGVSVRVPPGAYLEGHGTLGAADAEQAWGLALRVAF